MNIESELDNLSDLQRTQELNRQNYEAERQKILAPLQAELDRLNAEFGLVDQSQAIEALTAAIRNAVIARGESVKGTFLHAIYAKGRVTWDNKGLDGFMVAHPEIGAFRKVGEPSVSIRSLK